MFCNKCGNELEDDMKYCNKCGYKIERKESDIYKIRNYYNEEIRIDEKSLKDMDLSRTIGEKGIGIDELIKNLLEQREQPVYLYKDVLYYFKQKYNTYYNGDDDITINANYESSIDLAKMNLEDLKNKPMDCLEEKEKKQLMDKIKKAEQELDEIVREKIALIHNYNLFIIKRLEIGIDSLIPEAKERYNKVTYKKEIYEKRSNNKIAFFVGKILAIIYTIIIFKYINDFFNGGIIELFTSEEEIFIKLIFIFPIGVYFIVTTIGRIYFFNELYPKYGILTYLLEIFGGIYMLIVFIAKLARYNNELELGYSDPSKSDIEIHNEVEKLRAAQKINRGR